MSWGLDDVRVSRGGSLALAGATVPADPGRITVLVGGDGAGKSTCLGVLAGLIEPAAGFVRRPAKERIGYVPATGGIYADLTVEENLAFFAAAYRLPGAERRGRSAEILRQTGLAGATTRLGGQLSGGMQRKLAVGLALLHEPELLILDEPTTGVDPVSRAELWRLISRAAASGTAVVVSTTYLNEAARAARVVLLAAGSVLASGSPEDILGGVPGLLGSSADGARPAELSWRRGASWRVWAPAGRLPDGARQVLPDFEDAVVVAELGRELAGHGSEQEG
ncbi:MAG TPA: ABC transporter ATP-binding protein [Streptosporangiaceae bacterium]|jgi:ABC-2 type transport system ATP-binding protein